MSSKFLQQATALAPKIQRINQEVLAKHIKREDVVRATWLSLISSRPAFFLGRPGVDKTGTIQGMAKRIDGADFYEALMPTIVSVEQLLVESTSIEEMPTASGGKSIKATDSLGRAANAHLFFADEIWKAEPRLLQTLIDLSKGDGVRHDGQMVKTPLLAFLAASNELPDPEGNLGAVWSRMTIRVVVDPLDRGGKLALVKARLARDRMRANQLATGHTRLVPEQLTLDEVKLLRQARPLVEVPEEIMELVLDLVQELVDSEAHDFSWLWADDRRFGRVFDVLQASALLAGRNTVNKSDLAALEWLWWDTPEEISTVKALIAPYCRTPLMDAKELVNALLAPGGTVAAVLGGDRVKGVQALTQIESTEQELHRLKGEADTSEYDQFGQMTAEVAEAKADVIAIVTGQKVPGKEVAPA